MKKQPIKKHLQSIYVVAPLLLLLLCLGLINLVEIPISPIATTTPTDVMPSATVQKSNTPQTTAIATPSSTAMMTSIPPATPPPLPTPEATPHIPSGTQIRLLGPPSGTTFSLGDKITFYWSWSLPLMEEESFALYLLHEDEEYLVGNIAESNLGTAYYMVLPVQQVTEQNGLFVWQVRLESGSSTTPLVISDQRSFNLLENR